MRKLESRLTLRVLFSLLALAVILATPPQLNAQKRKPIPSGTAKPPSADSPSAPKSPYRTMDQAVFEMSVLMAQRNLVGDLERERRRLTVQLSQDLEQLDEINAHKMVPLSAATAIDYKCLAEASADIKTRATRIKFYSPIALVDRTGEKIQYDADANELGKMLPKLSRTIASFVGNPVFRISSPNDDELRSVAAHDLEGIIKLSDTINKIAKRLSKTMIASR